MRLSAFALVLVAVLGVAPSLLGQAFVPQREAEPTPFDFYARGPWRGEVARPAVVLGYEPEGFTPRMKPMSERSARWRVARIASVRFVLGRLRNVAHFTFTPLVHLGI